MQRFTAVQPRRVDQGEAYDPWLSSRSCKPQIARRGYRIPTSRASSWGIGRVAARTYDRVSSAVRWVGRDIELEEPMEPSINPRGEATTPWEIVMCND